LIVLSAGIRTPAMGMLRGQDLVPWYCSIYACLCACSTQELFLPPPSPPSAPHHLTRSLDFSPVSSLWAPK